MPVLHLPCQTIFLNCCARMLLGFITSFPRSWSCISLIGSRPQLHGIINYVMILLGQFHCWLPNCSGINTLDLKVILRNWLITCTSCSCIQMQVQNRVWIWDVRTPVHQDIIEVLRFNFQVLGVVQWMVLYSGTRLTGEEQWVPKLNTHILLEVTLVSIFYFSNWSHKLIVLCLMNLFALC
jgi:hypothetical protein